MYFKPIPKNFPCEEVPLDYFLHNRPHRRTRSSNALCVDVFYVNTKFASFSDEGGMQSTYCTSMLVLTYASDLVVPIIHVCMKDYDRPHE